MRTLLRASRFYDTVALVKLYKSNVLSFIEYGTPAFYHASPSVLAALDGIQSAFLDHLSVSSRDALLKLNLAPLTTRRDIAMLGLLHRIRLGTAPACLANLFPFRSNPIYSYGRRDGPPRHQHQSDDPVSAQSPLYMKRSVFGLLRVYNGLAPDTVELQTVKSFQRKLQNLVKDATENGSWESVLSPCS